MGIVEDIISGRVKPTPSAEFLAQYEADIRTYFTQAGMSPEGVNQLKLDYNGENATIGGRKDMSRADQRILDKAFEKPRRR